MKRVALAAAAAAAVLAVGPGAQAKSPPSGFHVCGASACVHLGSDQWARLWSGGREIGRPLRVPAPFYGLRWKWYSAGPEQTAYYVPSAPALRWPNQSGEPATWIRIGPTSAAAIDAATAELSPYPATPPSAVTVGAKQARGPETYFRLLRGPAAGLAPLTVWISVSMRSDPTTPWTDDLSEIRISAPGQSRLVLVDGWVHRVPLWIANRARRGLPLSR